MINILRPEKAPLLLKNVLMVKSRRDGRLGIVAFHDTTNSVVFMENLSTPLRLPLVELCKGFGFIFSKREMIEEWYSIKRQRRSVPRLNTEYDIFVAMETIMAELSPYFPTLLNHEVFIILKNMKRKYESKR